MRKILLPILLLATLALCKDFNTYIVNPAKIQGEEATISATDLIQTLKHNFGALNEMPSDAAIALIKSAGKSAANLLNPVQTNFLVFLKGQFTKQEESKIAGSSAVPVKLSIEENEDTLFDSLFNLENPESLVSSVAALSADDEDTQEKKEFYLFSQDKRAGDIFEDFGLAVSVDQSGRITIEDKQSSKTHRGESFTKCVNKAIGPNYTYANKAISNQDGTSSISFTADNESQLSSFLSEMCGLQTIASAFKKDTSSLLALEVSSLSFLQSVLTTQELTVAKDVIAQTVSKVISHFEEVQDNKSFGQIIFTEGEEEQNFFSLAAASPVSKKGRKLAYVPTAAQQVDAQYYTLRAWFSLFFVALIFFVCYAMFNVEIAKDSLLYAKFIADDRR